jgi:hypothetical protein
MRDKRRRSTAENGIRRIMASRRKKERERRREKGSKKEVRGKD